MKKIKLAYQLLVFLFYFGISLFIQKDIIQEFPHHIHAWAHIDHYAISKGFIKNNFDFFHPETATENKQFPSTDHPEKLSKVTSADFPIVQYTAALLMKTFGTQEPIVYRILMLLLAVLGLLYLFKISYFFSENAVIALLTPLVIFFTPVYLDYQVGFLPTMASMSLFFVGIYHYIRFNDTENSKSLLTGIVWLSMATAIRTPMAIPLIAILCYELLKWARRKSKFKNVLIIACGFILPIVYFAYNQYLRAEYGSIFLGSPLPANNLEELLSNISDTHQTWFYHYFSKLQWSIILLSVISLPVLGLLRQELLPKQQRLIGLSLIYGCGVLTYMLLMSRQFVRHDYYALDTFIPFLGLIAVVLISRFTKTARVSSISPFLLFGMLIIVLNNNLGILSERRKESLSQPYTEMYEAYSNLKSLLDSKNIDADTDFLVLDHFAPNMPFILGDLHGANLMKLDSLSIAASMQWPQEYIIIRNDVFYSIIYPMYPELYNQTTLIAYDGNIMLLKKKDSFDDIDSYTDWLNIDENAPLKVIKDYEGISDVKIVDGEGTCDTEFAMTFRDTLQEEGYRLMSVSGFFSKEETSEALLHIHIQSEKNDLFNKYIPIPLDPEKIVREIILPDDLNQWYISIYLYNPNKNVVHYQDFEIKYY